MMRTQTQYLSVCLPMLVAASLTLHAQQVTRCSSEGEVCKAGKDHIVFYGANGKWNARSLQGPIACSSEVFGGDPAPGAGKACYLASGLPEACGSEGKLCRTPPRTRRVFVYGANGVYFAKEVRGAVACTSPTFGADPVPGVQKSCYLLPFPDFEHATAGH